MKPTRFLTMPFALIAVFAAALLGGCAGYERGAGASLPFDSVYVAPVVNRSLAPQAQALLSDQIATRLQEGGRLRLGSEGNSQAKLEVTLVDFIRTLGITDSRDTQVARAFNLELVAEVTLVDNRDGKVYLNKQRISAMQQVFPVNSQSSAEYNGMPALTAKLALAIANSVEGAW